MNQRFHFTPDSAPEQQLLAMSIVVLELLRKHKALTLWVPATVHRALPASNYGILLYDTLSAEYPDLETRLQLRVHPAAYFDVSFTS